MVHLSQYSIGLYRQKRLPPAELLAADQHLAVCPVCRTQLQATGPAPQLWSDWQEASPLFSEHLSYTQMEAYVENRLGEIEREIVVGHTAVCQQCAREVCELQAFASSIRVPEPLPRRSFWEAFHVFLSMPRYQLVSAAAIVLVAAVLLPVFLLQTGEEPFVQVWQYQARLQQRQDLSALTREHSVLGEHVATFGFAAESEAIRFFRLGVLYAEALAYLHGGNVEAGTQRWSALEQEVTALQVSAPIIDHVRTVRAQLAKAPGARPESSALPAHFQPLIEAYASRKGTEQRTLFQLGTWLVNVSLTAAANETALLQQAATAQHFQTALYQLQAPHEVLELLRQIDLMMQKPTLATAEVQHILDMAKKLQLLLG